MTSRLTVNGGVELTCCWDDCERPARRGEDLVITEPATRVRKHVPFCGGRHRHYWRQAYLRTPGQRLPSGLYVP